MVTREQMDTLSLRVGNILELVSDLRVENSQLKAEIDEMKVRQEQYDRKVDEQGKETRRLREQLDERNAKLNQLILKEEELENFLLQVIGQMDSVGLAEFQQQFAAVEELRIHGGGGDDAAAAGDPGEPAEVVQVEFGPGGPSVERTTNDQAGYDDAGKDLVEVMIRQDGEVKQVR